LIEGRLLYRKDRCNCLEKTSQNRILEHVALYMLRITHNLPYSKLLFILQFKIYVKLSVWEVTGCFIGKIVVIPLKNLTDPNLPSENSTCRLLYAYLIVLYFVLESKGTFRWRSNKFQLLFHSPWCIPIRNSCCTRSIWCETESQTLKLFNQNKELWCSYGQYACLWKMYVPYSKYTTSSW
jgi:hypothetical protein